LTTNELTTVSATRLASLIRGKNISVREVIDAHLRRIEEINPKLNAVVLVNAAGAQAEAGRLDKMLAQGQLKGPLHGVPFTVKDAFETEGQIATGGTLGRKNYVARRTATAVARLQEAGGILLGKTNCAEMSLGYETDNLVFGRTNNPYDLGRTPGGSTGGESAIVAAGGSPLGLGCDGGGSIRLPAHYCGIAGLKPSIGRVPRTGQWPPEDGVSDSLKQVGPMARYVEDLVLTLPLLAGPDWHDPWIVPMTLGDPRVVDLKKLRVVFHTDNGLAVPSLETAEAVKAACRALAAAGAEIEEKNLPGIEQAEEIMLGIWSADGGRTVERRLEAIGTRDSHPYLKNFLELLRTHPMSTADLYELLTQWNEYRSALTTFMKPYDAILSPVNAYPAVPHGGTQGVEMRPAFSYTIVYNLTGWPGAVVRMGSSPEGLPIGVQIVTPSWREDVALAVAQHLETVSGGWQAPPL